MSENVWATILVPIASIIGIVITQVWSFRSLKDSRVLEERARFFKEAFRDTYQALSCLAKIEQGQPEKENIGKIQSLIDNHPYNFPLGFMDEWNKNSEKINSASTVEIRKLTENLRFSLDFYGNKYFKEVLGFKGEEVKDLIQALRGNI